MCTNCKLHGIQRQNLNHFPFVFWYSLQEVAFFWKIFLTQQHINQQDDTERK